MACHEHVCGRRLVARIVISLLVSAVFVLSAACARRANERPPESPSVTASAGSSAKTQTSASTSGSKSDSPTGTGASPPGSHRPTAIKWIRDYTPAGGGSNGRQEGAYRALEEGDCATTFRLANDTTTEQGPGGQPVEEPYRSLYRVVASRLAAFHSQTTLWATATKALEVQRGGLDCWDNRKMTCSPSWFAHQNDQTRASTHRPEGSSGGSSACPNYSASARPRSSTRRIPRELPVRTAHIGDRLRWPGRHRNARPRRCAALVVPLAPPNQTTAQISPVLRRLGVTPITVHL
jgi:hypothetical protein